MPKSGAKREAGKWLQADDKLLQQAVSVHKKNWKKISEVVFAGRKTPLQCSARHSIIDPHRKKGCWSSSEDRKVVELVKIYGLKKWAQIAVHLPGRQGKQCRERWHNHLQPDIRKGPWSEEEDQLLLHFHSMHGNKWAVIAQHIPGRTQNNIKNHWNSSMNKVYGAAKGHGVTPLPAITERSRSRSRVRRNYGRNKTKTARRPKNGGDDGNAVKRGRKRARDEPLSVPPAAGSVTSHISEHLSELNPVSKKRWVSPSITLSQRGKQGEDGVVSAATLNDDIFAAPRELPWAKLADTSYSSPLVGRPGGPSATTDKASPEATTADEKTADGSRVRSSVSWRRERPVIRMNSIVDSSAIHPGGKPAARTHAATAPRKAPSTPAASSKPVAPAAPLKTEYAVNMQLGLVSPMGYGGGAQDMHIDHLNTSARGQPQPGTEFKYLATPSLARPSILPPPPAPTAHEDATTTTVAGRATRSSNRNARPASKFTFKTQRQEPERTAMRPQIPSTNPVLDLLAPRAPPSTAFTHLGHASVAVTPPSSRQHNTALSMVEMGRAALSPSHMYKSPPPTQSFVSLMAAERTPGVRRASTAREFSRLHHSKTTLYPHTPEQTHRPSQGMFSPPQSSEISRARHMPMRTTFTPYTTDSAPTTSTTATLPARLPPRPSQMSTAPTTSMLRDSSAPSPSRYLSSATPQTGATDVSSLSSPSFTSPPQTRQGPGSQMQAQQEAQTPDLVVALDTPEGALLQRSVEMRAAYSQQDIPPAEETAGLDVIDTERLRKLSQRRKRFVSERTQKAQKTAATSPSSGEDRAVVVKGPGMSRRVSAQPV